jgi:hypothetical protein
MRLAWDEQLYDLRIHHSPTTTWIVAKASRQPQRKPTATRPIPAVAGFAPASSLKPAASPSRCQPGGFTDVGGSDRLRHVD